MSDDEIKNKNLDLIEYFVGKVLDTVKKKKKSRTTTRHYRHARIRR